MVSLPTGTGKTVVFASMPRLFGLKRRMLVLAHRQELLDQAASKFAAITPHLRVGIEQAGREASEESRIVLASVATLGRADSSRLRRLSPEDFYLIVVDEAHHAVAPSYRRIFDHFGLFDPGTPRLLVGFTATPRRGDKKTLSSVFQEVAYSRAMPDMVREGHLCSLRGFRVSTRINLSSVGVRHGDFIESELASLVDVPERNRLIVRAYRELAGGRCAVVFCVNVAHAQELALAFRKEGIAAGAVWGAMPKDERACLLQDFHHGSVQVLTNCNVLTEGFDEPRVDCVLMARPTQSQLLYAQMVGRGTRLHPGKEDLIVVDIVDNTSKHRLANLNTLFDLPEQLDLEGRPALEVVDHLERLSASSPWIDLARLVSADELELVSERIDLFRLEPPDEIAAFTDFCWCGRPDGSYRLLLPEGESVTLQEDHLGNWRATLSSPGRPQESLPSRDRLKDAVQAVDHDIRRNRPELVRVLSITAQWRDAAPSEKQLAFLQRRNIPIPEGLTKGQASWMIAHTG